MDNHRRGARSSRIRTMPMGYPDRATSPVRTRGANGDGANPHHCQRTAPVGRRGGAAHQPAHLAAGPGPDGREGRLRRRRVRRLRRPRRAARRRRRDPLDIDQLLPAARRGPGRPGGRHRRGHRHRAPHRHRGSPPPRPARDGRARRLPVRLLHPRLRLLDGRRVLPSRALRLLPAREGTCPAGEAGTRGQDDDEHGANGFDLHALSGNLCRCTGYRPIRDAAFALGDPEEGDPLAAPATPLPRRPDP